MMTLDLNYEPLVGPEVMELIVGEDDEFAVRFEIDRVEWEAAHHSMRDVVRFKVMGRVKTWVGGTLTTLRWPG